MIDNQTTTDPDFLKFLNWLHSADGELFINSETGFINSYEDWLLSYSSKELTKRNLTADEAFMADLHQILFPIKESTLEAINKEYHKHFEYLKEAFDFLLQKTKVFGLTENTIVYVSL